MKSKQAATDEGWMRETWEWAVEVGESQNLAVYFVCTPTARKGVWAIRCKGVLVRDGKVVDTLGSSEAEYPNGRAATLTSLMFLLASELSTTLMGSSE